MQFAGHFRPISVACGDDVILMLASVAELVIKTRAAVH